jgi:hypothetical protein
VEPHTPAAEEEEEENEEGEGEDEEEATATGYRVLISIKDAAKGRVMQVSRNRSLAAAVSKTTGVVTCCWPSRAAAWPPLSTSSHPFRLFAASRQVGGLVTDHLRIHRVTMHEAGSAPSPDSVFGGNDEAPTYAGPSFEELDDALQVRREAAASAAVGGVIRGGWAHAFRLDTGRHLATRSFQLPPFLPCFLRTRSTTTWRSAASTMSWPTR